MWQLPCFHDVCIGFLGMLVVKVAKLGLWGVWGGKKLCLVARADDNRMWFWDLSGLCSVLGSLQVTLSRFAQEFLTWRGLLCLQGSDF